MKLGPKQAATSPEIGQRLNSYPLLHALQRRRSRRFAAGMSTVLAHLEIRLVDRSRISESPSQAKNLAHNPRCVIGTEMAGEPVIIEDEATLVGDDENQRYINLTKKKYKFDMS